MDSHLAKLGDLLGEVSASSAAKGFEKNHDDAVVVVGAAVVSIGGDRAMI